MKYYISNKKSFHHTQNLINGFTDAFEDEKPLNTWFKREKTILLPERPKHKNYQTLSPKACLNTIHKLTIMLHK